VKKNNILQIKLTFLYLFHYRTCASYVYNGCLAWYNVVLTHGSTQAWNTGVRCKFVGYTTGNSCDGGINVLYNCLS